VTALRASPRRTRFKAQVWVVLFDLIAIMSTWRNAAKRKTHKERHQPEARERFGLLEKHKVAAPSPPPHIAGNAHFAGLCASRKRLQFQEAEAKSVAAESHHQES
jgi:hypothetical protein